MRKHTSPFPNCWAGVSSDVGAESSKLAITKVLIKVYPIAEGGQRRSEEDRIASWMRWGGGNEQEEVVRER
jgi:hypothetical protein